jgi:hypothetical protein
VNARWSDQVGIEGRGSTMGRVRIGRRAGIVMVGIATVFVATAPAAPAAPRVGPAHRHIAGYLQTGTGADNVNTIFTVPTATCPDAGAPFQGTAEGGIIYTATGGFSDAAVATGCFGSTPTYSALITIDGVQTQYPDPVAPGDIIIVEVRGGAGGMIANIRDKTQHWRHAQNGGVGRTTTEMGVGSIAFGCGPSGCSPAAQLSVTHFKATVFNFQGLGNATKSAFKAADGTVEMNATTAPPSGKLFATRWVSTCDPGMGTLC